MLTRRHFLNAALATPVLGLGLRAAQAAEPEIYAEGGLAIGGYDPVAYFLDARPVAGVRAHEAEWKGARWRFVTAENLARFMSAPGRYAPQYGGYCAYAVSRGYTASTAPNAWTVHAGRLYLNYNRVVRGLWARDIPGNVVRADANWPAVLST